jgi:glycosyltransferase involved in cell wall biosynthesis
MNALHKDEKKFDAIVCLSAIDWDFLRQRTQEVMSQFAAMGYPVLFIENTGVRIPKLKDLPRVIKRLQKSLGHPKTVSSTRLNDNITVLSPLAIPSPYSKVAIKINSILLRNKVLNFSKSKNIPLNRILLWSYMTTPLAVELAKSLPWAGVVVDLVSDPCKVQGAEAIIASHKEMLELANIVCCASVPTLNVARQQLEEHFHYKLHLFEDGFSTRLISMVENESDHCRLPVLNEEKPIAAYIGGVNNKIWWNAVSVMAAESPEVNFVFVGPKEENELPCKGANKNIYWYPFFGKYSQLGFFLKNCNVGLIPYVPTPYVMEMRPAKINEYLVMGLPIVGTRMPELERLGELYGTGIVYLADKPDDFVIKLKQALDEDCEVYKDKRRKLACSRSWEKVCKEMHDYLQTTVT